MERRIYDRKRPFSKFPTITYVERYSADNRRNCRLKNGLKHPVRFPVRCPKRNSIGNTVAVTTGSFVREECNFFVKQDVFPSIGQIFQWPEGVRPTPAQTFRSLATSRDGLRGRSSISPRPCAAQEWTATLPGLNEDDNDIPVYSAADLALRIRCDEIADKPQTLVPVR